MIINVPVVFHGTVAVKVPDDATSPKSLAESLALAKVIASVENPDSASAEDNACGEYQEENGIPEEQAEREWDDSECLNVVGTWISDYKLTDEQRKELKDRLWASLEGSVHAYSQQIANLLNELTDDELVKYVNEQVGK